MVFLDTNIILEIILKNRIHSKKVIQFLKTITDTTAISLLSVHLIMYFGRKEQIDNSLLENLILENELLSITDEDYLWARDNEIRNDFEDALQVATALRNKCDKFITLDGSLQKNYSNLPIEIIKL